MEWTCIGLFAGAGSSAALWKLLTFHDKFFPSLCKLSSCNSLLKMFFLMPLSLLVHLTISVSQKIRNVIKNQPSAEAAVLPFFAVAAVFVGTSGFSRMCPCDHMSTELTNFQYGLYYCLFC